MLTIDDFVFTERSALLIAMGLATLIVACLTSVHQWTQARKARGVSRLILAGTSVSSGLFAIWSTHWVASRVLAPPPPDGFGINPDMLTYIAGVVLTGIGAGMSIRDRWSRTRDLVTGLENRANFIDRLDREITSHQVRSQTLALLCLDIDGFKNINDLYGHTTGDHALREVARKLSATLSRGQTLARLGGDEFAILMPTIESPTEVRLLVERLQRNVLAGTNEIGLPGSISVSVGVAMYPSDASDRAELLTYADTALHRAKDEKSGSCRFFDAAMGQQLRERRTIEEELHKAIQDGQFHLVYQPQAKIRTGEVTGFEALLRWTHPTRGNVSPGLFIPIAEESSFILTLGEWVLRNACQEAATWERPLKVAVNISARQLIDAGLADLVSNVLAETNLPPGRLEIEVTETALISDPNRALDTLNRLKALGVSIAMDDFGTGYSSLSNVREFPLDKIKIDQSFIRAVHANRQAASIVRAVRLLCDGMGLPVIAEGVETADELNFLIREGFTDAQGYFLGAPVPASEIATSAFDNVIPLPTTRVRLLSEVAVQ
ncbi:putative bifunctional diguanylate cyclase/phosphodiesterase [Microvirga sp. Mcv34]|uniref:putative bifunctional diguanylate cyclase/phosphodiesterase n=1 Tax=Microvirga sp. Mcv34 TaxID=2926016 RepID=UPI0021C7B61E|nr:EAL domain-containing protein [Microvirga sp. Mcv34]